MLKHQGVYIYIYYIRFVGIMYVYIYIYVHIYVLRWGCDTNLDVNDQNLMTWMCVIFGDMGIGSKVRGSIESLVY